MSAERMIDALRDARCYPHPADAVEVIETHISWIVLAGEFAYKLKKPVELGFLDFSTPELRRRSCDEELRLNRRLAPRLYLDVVAVTGTEDAPRIGGDGPVLEHAVRMRRFAPGSELSAMLARGDLLPRHIDELARLIGAFYQDAPRAPPDSSFGTPAVVRAACLENFALVRAGNDEASRAARLDALERWTLGTLERLAPAIEARRRDGFVRECHGDLHLANVALVDGEVVAFDALEFNAALRWTDVIAEVAFTVMDLRVHGRGDLAQRFLNGWLAATGDYAGLALLPLELVYRSMVRAKVAALRAAQCGDAGARDGLWRDVDVHLAFAERTVAPREPVLAATCGLSGSGKSRVAAALAEAGDWIVIRSDVERKRLAGLAPLARSGSSPGTGLYTEQATQALHARLAALATAVLRAGLPVIVDATFLARNARDAIRSTARAAGARFVLLSVHAPADMLRARVARRSRDANDASEADLAVLERQLATRDPVGADERQWVVEIDTAQEVDAAALSADAMRAARPA